MITYLVTTLACVPPARTFVYATHNIVTSRANPLLYTSRAKPRNGFLTSVALVS